MRAAMLSRRTLLTLAAVLGTLTCAIVWWAVRTVIAPEGMTRTIAVIQSQRVEEAPTQVFRLYERDRRFIVQLGWGEGEERGSAETEVSPFEYQRLRLGESVPAFVALSPAPAVQLRLDAAYEVFLVVLGVGSMVASLILVAVGLQLEERGTGDSRFDSPAG